MESEIKDKIENKEATIGIIGLGYVGLPLVLRFSSLGFPIVGFDIDSNKVQMLARRETYLEHIPSERLNKELHENCQFTSDFSRIGVVDVIIICVPTPLGSHNEPDLSFVTGTVDSITPYLRAHQVISLESTTYPGTTEEEIVSKVECQGFTVGDDLFVLYSPEREDPGNKDYTTSTIPKVVGGHTRQCLDVGIALYSSVIDTVIPVSSTKVAEMTKLLENIYRSVNIGLVNELKLATAKMGIDIYEVINAAATKPFGFTPFYPGPGLGGHCIPIDPYYLTWKAREYNVHTRFIELAGEVNSAMPRYVVERTILALNSRSKSAHGSRILILGVAYKPDVDDMRESPAMDIMVNLAEMGAKVEYHDPHVDVIPKMRKYDLQLSSIPLTQDVLEHYDAVVLITNHSSIDYDLVNENAQLIIDTRGVFAASPKVVKA